MENCYVNQDKNQGVPAWYGFSGHNYPAMSISLHNFGYNAIRIEPLNQILIQASSSKCQKREQI
ncbi:hypothetical protein DFO77_102217 [Marinilabilia salmonicolor]|uniref:Uncharacterized protein n=1 Tax=Marinilabilia salmonicolor TaxID=989 RepID=A0A368VD67_9BACT|nr:hypothetical protein DFO77_102217 [Marinilabilia salmonicolor]